MAIDPSAIIHETAKIHKGATILASAVVGANVEIGAGTVVDSHAVLQVQRKLAKTTTSIHLPLLAVIPKILPIKMVKKATWLLVMTI